VASFSHFSVAHISLLTLFLVLCVFFFRAPGSSAAHLLPRVPKEKFQGPIFRWGEASLRSLLFQFFPVIEVSRGLGELPAAKETCILPTLKMPHSTARLAFFFFRTKIEY